MVPDDVQGVLLAKKVCAECPVTSRCFAYAESLTATFGKQYAAGIWGGLSLQERNTMVGLDRAPAPCPGCGLICVPVSYTTDRCSSCDPETSLSYPDYRDRALLMIEQGCTYQQVADALRLDREPLASACYRWGVKAKTASKRGRRPLKECGTLAAKTRHSRRGESWKNCSCRHVPWKKGTPRAETRER